MTGMGVGDLGRSDDSIGVLYCVGLAENGGPGIQ